MIKQTLQVTLCAALCLAVDGQLAADPGERTTTLADQHNVNVTIYNADLALVHDRRGTPLAKGENRLAWRDVSAKIDATSALVESISAPGSLSVIEQNFNFDLLTPAALLQKAVGQEVTVVHRSPLPGEPQRERAKVLAANDGIVLQYADRIETSLTAGSQIIYTSLPPNLRDRPTLVLGLDSLREQNGDLELSYLTGGLGWSADYVGQVSAAGDRVDLTGLVTLTNTSGTTYSNANVQLVAGNVNVPPPTGNQLKTIGMVRAIPMPQAQQENFFEYHLYTLPRPTTIGENQTKQVGFMSAHAVPIKESLEVRGDAYYYTAHADLGTKQPVAAYVSFENKGGDLGVPLPGGLVRLYKTDSRGISQFLGADRIDHTPKNETVRLHLGDAFDVTAVKKQTDYHVVSAGVSESAYAITLGNAKTEPVDVLVVEPIPGDWSILSESLPHTKPASNTASWTVHVPPGEHVTLTYSVRVKYS